MTAVNDAEFIKEVKRRWPCLGKCKEVSVVPEELEEPEAEEPEPLSEELLGVCRAVEKKAGVVPRSESEE